MRDVAIVAGLLCWRFFVEGARPRACCMLGWIAVLELQSQTLLDALLDCCAGKSLLEL